ncbi:MAG: glycosyltransferase family 2 protein [Candidatus Woesearchaeota archaeon]
MLTEVIPLWSHKKVSLIFLTKNNSDSIRNQAEEGFMTGFVDEVLVVDSSSSDRTLSEISYTKARIASCPNIFEAFRTSIARASGDIIVFGDPSGVVPSKELVKLLAYTDTSSCVFGSRRRWLMNELNGSDKVAFARNVSHANSISDYTVVAIDDILPPIFALERSAMDFDVDFSGFTDLLSFDILKDCIRHGCMYFQIPIEYHSYSLEKDRKVFSDRKMRKTVKALRKELKRHVKTRQKSTLKRKVTDDSEDHKSDDDPTVIKRRLSYLRKRLGDYDKPFISQEARAKIENAVRDVSRNKSSSSSQRRKFPKRQRVR